VNLPAPVLQALAVALLGLATGCQSLPRHTFPIGIFGAANPGDLPTVAAAGFNVVAGPATQAYLDAAHHHGLSVLARPGTSADAAPFDCDQARTTVRRFDGHPALWAWNLSDEPDLHRIPPAILAAARGCLTEAGARKPTALVLFNGREADQYAGLTDRLLLDRYPVPWLPIADLPKHLRLARFAAGGRQPVYAVVQAFDWAGAPEQIPQASGFRPPDAAEIRAMTFLALVEGARGIFYYAYRDGRWDLEQHPETWAAVRDAVREIHQLEPLFRDVPAWRSFQIHYPDPRQQRNEALDPSVQAALFDAGSGGVDLAPGAYLVAVNSTRNPVTWQFRWPQTGTGFGELQVRGADQPLRPNQGWYSLRFEPLGVRVVGPLPSSVLIRPGIRATR